MFTTVIFESFKYLMLSLCVDFNWLLVEPTLFAELKTATSLSPPPISRDDRRTSVFSN